MESSAAADTPQMTLLQIGIKSFWELSNAFVTTVVGQPINTSASPQPLTCGASTNDDSSSSSSSTTYFYLENPLQSASEPCTGSDWIVIVILIIIIHTISWGTRWIVWEPLADKRMKNVPTWNATECRRFSTACAACQNFILSAVFVWRILFHKPWLFDRGAWSEGGLSIDADFKFYYLMYAARFLSDMISLYFESRQFDALMAAFIHHLATLGLVLCSALVGLTRYGGIIMFFFDWADIPLLCAKAFKYLSKSPHDSFQYTANRLFEVFTVLFFITRCVCFNYVVYATWCDLSNDWVDRVCKYLLLVLVVLQTYWMGLVIKAAIRISKNGGVAEDSRDDDLKKKH
jgi:hypothetical protein